MEEIEVMSNRLYNSLAKHKMHDLIGVLKQYALEEDKIPGAFIKGVLMHGSKRIQHLGVFHDMLDLDKIPVNADYSIFEDDTVQDQEIQQDNIRNENALKFWRKHITGYDDTHEINDIKHTDDNKQQQQSQIQDNMVDSADMIANRFLKTISLKNNTLHDAIQSLANYGHANSLSPSKLDEVFSNAIKAYPQLSKHKPDWGEYRYRQGNKMHPFTLATLKNGSLSANLTRRFRDGDFNIKLGIKPETPPPGALPPLKEPKDDFEGSPFDLQGSTFDISSGISHAMDLLKKTMSFGESDTKYTPILPIEKIDDPSPVQLITFCFL